MNKRIVEIADERGWNAESLLFLSLAYIENHDGLESFAEFLEDVAREESGMGSEEE